MLGGLRYNRADLLGMILERSMLPLEKLRGSSFYLYILDEGRAEGRAEGEAKVAAKALRMWVAKRFPRLNISKEIARIHDAAILQQLFAESPEVKTAAALRKSLAKYIK